MKLLGSLVLMMALAAPFAQAAIVDFEADAAPGQGLGSYSSGGLTFTDSGSLGLGIWDGSSPNGNGTNNLIYSSGFGGGDVIVTRTGGGLFDLISLDLVISWYASTSADTILFNGVAQTVTTTLTTYVLNLTGLSSFSISGLIDDPNMGYWSADNVVYETAVVPLPAALPLMLLALGGLGIAARRRRS